MLVSQNEDPRGLVIFASDKYFFKNWHFEKAYFILDFEDTRWNDMEKRKSGKPEFDYWCRACHRLFKLKGKDHVKCPNPDCGRNELCRKRNITKKQVEAFKLIALEWGEGPLPRKEVAEIMGNSPSAVKQLLAEVRKERPELYKGLTEEETMAYFYGVQLGWSNSEVKTVLNLPSPRAAGQAIGRAKKKGMPIGIDLRKWGKNPVRKLSSNSAEDIALKRLQERQKTKETEKPTETKKLSEAEFKAERDRIYWESVWGNRRKPRPPLEIEIFP